MLTYTGVIPDPNNVLLCTLYFCFLSFRFLSVAQLSQITYLLAYKTYILFYNTLITSFIFASSPITPPTPIYHQGVVLLQSAISGRLFSDRRCSEVSFGCFYRGKYTPSKFLQKVINEFMVCLMCEQIYYLPPGISAARTFRTLALDVVNWNI